jgi:hypothetical protein
VSNDLKLARQVFRAHDVQTYETFDGKTAWKWRKNPHDENYTVWRFEPTGKHFADVLAWMVSSEIAVVEPQCVSWLGEYWQHDGTAAGIKQAVYQAALKIVEEE